MYSVFGRMVLLVAKPTVPSAHFHWQNPSSVSLALWSAAERHHALSWGSWAYYSIFLFIPLRHLLLTRKIRRLGLPLAKIEHRNRINTSVGGDLKSSSSPWQALLSWAFQEGSLVNPSWCSLCLSVQDEFFPLLLSWCASGDACPVQPRALYLTCLHHPSACTIALWACGYEDSICSSQWSREHSCRQPGTCTWSCFPLNITLVYLLGREVCPKIKALLIFLRCKLNSPGVSQLYCLLS